MKSVGLYIHIPYCKQKCYYCDFYSLWDISTAKAYTKAVVNCLTQMADRYPDFVADTVYLGGGTPNVLPPDCLEEILNTARTCFSFAGGEITCEVNPGRGYATTIRQLAQMGVNRLSVGMQSAVLDELQALGRVHTPQDVEGCIEQACKAGITNYSVDCMWGIPHQTVASALKTVDFALSLNPTHISAYLLKIEPNTPFGANPPLLPQEDVVCAIYQTCYEYLEQAGYLAYEISNFSRLGYESQHNLKYWNCENTLGIGPAAHSFMEGKRFYFPPDLAGFIQGAQPIPDGFGGDFTEYAMLQLRLKTGLQQADCLQRFGHLIPQSMKNKAASLVGHHLMEMDEMGMRLTVKGNLVSNEILATLL